MSDKRLNKLFWKADSDLSRAHKELYKPEEDVVNYSACISARSALYHYLGCLYILNDGKDDKNALEAGKKTVDELIDFVGKYHKGVTEMDFTPMRCSGKNIKDVLNNDEIYFCNNTANVQACTDLAEKMRELVVANAFGGVVPMTEQN